MTDQHTKATVPLAYGRDQFERDAYDSREVTLPFVRVRLTWWQRVWLWLGKVVGV